MPIIAYDLFMAIDILTNAVEAFTTKCVSGIQANREKAEGWLGVFG